MRQDKTIQYKTIQDNIISYNARQDKTIQRKPIRDTIIQDETTREQISKIIQYKIRQYSTISDDTRQYNGNTI